MTSVFKSVLITGCSAGGIGAGLAEVFREKGYHVFATARTASKIPKTLADAPNVTVLTLDVVSSDSIAAAVKKVNEETGGKLDVLVNNCGRNLVMPGLDASIEEGKKLFDLNFWAVLTMIQGFAPLLIKAKGYVVNNTSISGVLPMAFSSLYNSSKAAAIVGSETWRLELAPLGVRTLTLVTCPVKTNALSNVAPINMPKDSYYSGLRHSMEALVDGRLQANGVTPRQYAVKVIREIEKGTTGKYWVGGGATGACLACWLLPQSMMDKEIEKLSPFSSELANEFKKKNH